jgi:CDP-4-dehydro-6-deoxyglucose reductase, E3
MPQVQVSFGGNSYPLLDNESVLDCLLRNKQDVPHACKTGVCQSCLVKVTRGTVPDKARKGLKPTLQADGYALACQCMPVADVAVRLPGIEESATAVVIAGMDLLVPGIMRLRLVPAPGSTLFASRPGQYLNLINPAGISRSYSIANDFSADGFLELHIANAPQGLFTTWLFQQAKAGDVLHARGAAGDCFYVKDVAQDFPILLAGTGTGLAPLYGIVHDALRNQHGGPMTLLHGGRSAERLYYVDELHSLTQKHQRFSYRPLVLEAPASDARIQQGDLFDAALASLDPARLADTRVFLCGAPDFVQQLRKKIFLKGVRSSNIFCDAFVTRPVAVAA